MRGLLNFILCLVFSTVSSVSVLFGQCNQFYITGTASVSACKEASENVVWVASSSSTRHTISGNTLTKTSSNGNWDGNGFSFQSVSNNGYMQTTVAEINRDRMIGLSAVDANSNYTSIQYAFYLKNGGVLEIYESGSFRGAFGTYASGNVLKIAVENNVVKYYRNGIALFSSSIAPTLPLFVDVSTNSSGATVNDVKISNGNVGQFTAVANSAGTSPAYQWRLNGVNTGTNSNTYTNTNLVAGDVVTCILTSGTDGCLPSTVYNSNQIVIGNINQTEQNSFYISGSAATSACKEALVDVTWVISASSLRNTISANTLTKLTNSGSWDGNGFSFQSVSNNGYMQTTVAEINTERMIGLSATDANSNYTSIQYAFYLKNGGVLEIYESGNFRGTFGTYASGNVLKIAVENNVVKYYRNGTALFSSSVAPTLPLFVDVSNNSIGATANNVKISNGSTGTFTAAGTNLGSAPVYQWRLNGVNVGANSSTYTNTSLSNNDVVTCRVTPDLGGCTGNSFISNAITIADIDLTTQNEFYITATGAASACKEALVDVTWVISASSLRNTISANTLTKLTSGGSWDGNGFSFQSVSNNGYMQTTVAEINRDRMIGLSATDANSNYTSIQYAFYLKNGGVLEIHESGNFRGTFGTYASGDVLKIAVENNVVKYYRNGTVLFSSSVAPTLPLFVDVSNNSIGATANNVKISNGSSGIFTAAGIALGEAPVFQWRLNGVNVGTNSSTYTNTSLSNNDVVNCRVTPDLGGCTSSSFTSNSITIAEPTNATTTWIGTTNAWNTASNWTNGVPTKYTTAVISSGANNPLISTNAAVYGLTIGAGRTLTISNSSLSLEVYGNISNSGTFTPNNSTVILYGCSAPNTITSTSGISFFNLTVDNSFGVVLGGTSNVTATNSLNLINGVVTTGSNRLILSNSAASSLAYTNGFVFGNLRRNIASNTSIYFFPIANGSNTTDRHLAAIINNNLTGVTFINGSVVDFTQTSPNSDAFLNTRQGGYFLDRTIGETNGRTVIWDFTPSTAPTGGSYGVRLYAENTILSAADDNTFCPLKRNNTTSFVHFQTFDATTTIPSIGSPGRVFDSGNGYAQRTGYTSFSEFVIGKNSVEPLPIELLSFDARCHTGKIELTWSTATEINNDYFTIERSYDGINFSIVGNVEGAGNSSEILHYSLSDQAITEGTIYYRLKQTDFNGQFRYSDLMAIHCNQIIAENILVYPNPASLYVTIELPGNDELLPYELINTEGQVVQSGMITGKVTLSTNKVLPGIYFVKITSENGILREKIIIE